MKLKPMRVGLLAAATLTHQTNGQVAEATQEERWAQKTVEAFDQYCYRTQAEYAQILAVARALDLTEIPERFDPVLMGPDSVDGTAFLLAWDKSADVYLAVGASKPDACSVSAQGVEYGRVERILKDNFPLTLKHRDDVGLQVSELYSLAGPEASDDEAIEAGLVMVTRTKASVVPPQVTLAYVAPNTARVLVRE